GPGVRPGGRRAGRWDMSNVRKARGCLLLFLTALAAGCDLPGRPNPADRPVPADQVASFDVLYRMNCAGCHGADGNLGPAPPLNDPPLPAIVPAAELVRVIREGRAVAPGQNSPMPAFCLARDAPSAAALDENHPAPRQQGRLTPAQVKVLAEGIKKRW